MDIDDEKTQVQLSSVDVEDKNVIDKENGTHIYQEKKCILLVPEVELKYENHQKRTFICGLNMFNHYTPNSILYQDFKLKLPECEKMRDAFKSTSINPIFV